MIPEKAVEAAMEAYYASGEEPFEAPMRAALEAAAPYMRVSTQRPERGWIAKNRNPDGSVSIIGHFRNESEAEKYADMWPSSFVERA